MFLCKTWLQTKPTNKAAISFPLLCFNSLNPSNGFLSFSHAKQKYSSCAGAVHHPLAASLLICRISVLFYSTLHLSAPPCISRKHYHLLFVHFFSPVRGSHGMEKEWAWCPAQLPLQESRALPKSDDADLGNNSFLLCQTVFSLWNCP